MHVASRAAQREVAVPHQGWPKAAVKTVAAVAKTTVAAVAKTTVAAVAKTTVAAVAKTTVAAAVLGVREKQVQGDRLVGPVVKASASRAEDPGFDSRLRRDFSGVKSYH